MRTKFATKKGNNNAAQIRKEYLIGGQNGRCTGLYTVRRQIKECSAEAAAYIFYHDLLGDDLFLEQSDRQG
jgi:hypothetical protein